MDRFDCQYLMATFVNVYISSFILTLSPQKLLQQVRLHLYLMQCLPFIPFVGYDNETRATVADVLLSQGGLGEQRNPVSWKLNAIQLEICYFAFYKILLLVLIFSCFDIQKIICFA